MADNKLELIVTVEVDRANASIKSVNANLSSIEQTATKSARGASQGIDGMTAAMVKGATAGNLFAEAIKTALNWAKSWTIDAAKMAAHEARLEASGRALAKAHGIAGEAFEKAVESIRKIGYHGEDAIHTIDRLIIADIDLSKATGLAKLAKDAAAIENISAAEALENILRAIEFGNARALRSAGLRVDFERAIRIEELKLGRTLSENEQVQVRYNAVMREAVKIQGAHAAAAGEAESQMKALGREVHELNEAVGAEFQGQFKWLVGSLRDVVKWLRENTDLLAKFGQVALWVAGVLATYKLAEKIMALAKSIAALNLASMNPYALLATGVLAAGYAIYSTWQREQARLQQQVDEMERLALRRKVLEGEIRIEDLRRQGYTDEQLREIMTGRRSLTPETGEGAGWGRPRVMIEAPAEPSEDALKLAAAIRKRRAEVERESRQAAVEAGVKARIGFAREIAEMNAQIAKWTTFTDERGVEHRIALTRDVWVNVIDQLERRWSAYKRTVLKENRESLAEHLKAEEEAAHRRMDWDAQVYQRRLQHEEEWASKALEHSGRLLAFEEQRAGYGRDAQLRALEAFDAKTIQQKLWVEQRKMEIEIDYLERVHEVKMRLFDLETSRMVLEEEANLKRLGYRADEIRTRIGELTQQREDIRQQQQEAHDVAVGAARENAAIRQAQLVRDHNRQIFDSIKRQAEGVFDALLTKSQSIWSAIGNAFKTAMLTAIKEIVTSKVAQMLMQLFGYQGGSYAPAGVPAGSGTLGRLGGLLGIGAAPVFGGGGRAGDSITQGAQKTAAAVESMAQGAQKAAVAWQDIARNSVAIAGMMAFAQGLQQRSSVKSDIQLIGGGAAAGAAYGGWIGALIGALIGTAVAGFKRGGKAGFIMRWYSTGPIGAIVGLFIPRAEDKVREKVKATYGVDIRDKGVLKQIVEMAKQSFGGNIDMAIRSDQVRELIQLYAMSTGQKTYGMPGTARPLSLIQTGGALYQSPGYSNGSPLPSLGGLPTLGRIGGGTPSSAQRVVIQLDGPATTALLRGEAVQAVAENPRVVQGAALTATRANAGRRELLSLQLSPGTLVS